MDVVIVIIVPEETWLPEVAEHVLPPVAVVAHEMIVDPAVQVLEAVDGVTDISDQVILVPAHE